MDWQSISDAELMAKYLEGDERAFAELYRRHSPRIYGYIRKRITDGAQADDLFQKVFLHLHRSRTSYRPEYPLEAWLFTICRNALTDFFREAGRRREIPTEGVADDVRAEAPTDLEEADGVESLIPPGTLNTSAEAAVRLRYVDGLSFEEISRRLETSPTNVRQIVSRSVRKLKKVLGKGT